MRYTVRYFDFPFDGEKKVYRAAGFNRFEDALNEANFIYVNEIDEDVDIKDEEYDVIFSVKEEAWY